MRQRSIYATMFGLGGDAPTPEHEAERLRLRDVLMGHVREVGAAHPDRFWYYVFTGGRARVSRCGQGNSGIRKDGIRMSKYDDRGQRMTDAEKELLEAALYGVPSRQQRERVALERLEHDYPGWRQSYVDSKVESERAWRKHKRILDLALAAGTDELDALNDVAQDRIDTESGDA